MRFLEFHLVRQEEIISQRRLYVIYLDTPVKSWSLISSFLTPISLEWIDLPRHAIPNGLLPRIPIFSLSFTSKQLAHLIFISQVLFAVPRVVGWLAHWRQMMLQKGGVKIWYDPSLLPAG